MLSDGLTHSHGQAVIPGDMVAHEDCVSFPTLATLCVVSMGKIWRKELCSQPGRVAAEPQHASVTPVSCEFPLSLAKASAGIHQWSKRNHPCFLQVLLVPEGRALNLLFLPPGHKDSF